jgi:hypothetical protein
MCQAPASSFRIRDLLKPVYQIQGPYDPEARASMEKALLALNRDQLEAIEKNINSSGKKINPEILRKEISLAFRKADWETINDQLSTIESQATIRSLMENIQLQTEALRKMHVQTKPAAIQLKLRIRETQLQLQQETLKKEIQIIQKQNESVSWKENRIYLIVKRKFYRFSLVIAIDPHQIFFKDQVVAISHTCYPFSSVNTQFT